MNAQPLVNSCHTILNEEELNKAYDQIRKACTNQYKVAGTQQRDVEKALKILDKYFNKNNPILEINEALPEIGWTAMQAVSWLGLTDEARFLINNNADMLIASDKQSFPLHVAAAKAHEPVAFAILSNYPNLIDKINILKQSPFMLACESGNEKIVDLFLYYNPDTSLIDLKGQNCLDYAKNGGHKKIMSKVHAHIVKNSLSIHERRNESEFSYEADLDDAKKLKI
jgi:ankyrin repeat protein